MDFKRSLLCFFLFHSPISCYRNQGRSKMINLSMRYGPLLFKVALSSLIETPAHWSCLSLPRYPLGPHQHPMPYPSSSTPRPCRGSSSPGQCLEPWMESSSPKSSLSTSHKMLLHSSPVVLLGITIIVHLILMNIPRKILDKHSGGSFGGSLSRLRPQECVAMLPIATIATRSKILISSPLQSQSCKKRFK